MKKQVFLLCGWMGVVAAASVATAQEMPKPGPEHQAMGVFTGKWSFEGDAKQSDMGPGGKVSYTESCDWFEGGFAVVCRSEGKGPMGPMKAMSIMSYDTEKKSYTYYAVETGAPPFMASGKHEGKAWQWGTETKMGPQTLKTHVTITETSPTAYTFEMKASKDGGATWTAVMEGKSTKSGS